MSEIILSVHRINEQNSRLALSTGDINEIQPNTAERLFINLEGEDVEIVNGLTTYHRYGTLNSSEIYQWIRDNDYNVYPTNQNTKLIFTVTVNRGIHKYSIYPNQR